MSPFCTLPHEILHHILHYCTLDTLATLAHVSMSLRSWIQTILHRRVFPRFGVDVTIDQDGRRSFCQTFRFVHFDERTHTMVYQAVDAKPHRLFQDVLIPRPLIREIRRYPHDGPPDTPSAQCLYCSHTEHGLQFPLHTHSEGVYRSEYRLLPKRLPPTMRHTFTTQAQPWSEFGRATKTRWTERVPLPGWLRQWGNQPVKVLHELQPGIRSSTWRDLIPQPKRLSTPQLPQPRIVIQYQVEHRAPSHARGPHYKYIRGERWVTPLALAISLDVLAFGYDLPRNTVCPKTSLENGIPTSPDTVTSPTESPREEPGSTVRDVVEVGSLSSPSAVNSMTRTQGVIHVPDSLSDKELRSPVPGVTLTHDNPILF
ncbi:hypothetical protein IWQ61_007219 [Dispira simplex]|nr:hypothetical protein IWQ61_007219 [Dispira simplex]